MLTLLHAQFGRALLAVWLHGSAVAGGLRAHSDLDLFALTERPLDKADRQALARAIPTLSGRHPRKPGALRPIELIVMERGALTDPMPWRAEFVWGEWLRGTAVTAAPAPDPDLTLIVAQMPDARSLLGPPASALLPAVTPGDRDRAILASLPGLIAQMEGDERNVLLTLARMWRTRAHGDVLPKDAAADWAAARVPSLVARLLMLARGGYLGVLHDDWTGLSGDAHAAADTLRRQIEVAGD